MSNWSGDEIQAIARAWLVERKSAREIATGLGRSKSAVYRLIASQGWKGQQGNSTLYASLYRDYDYDPEAPKLRPIHIELPTREPVKTSPVEQVSLHWGDTHFPFEDEAAVDILYQIAHDLQPDILVCHGDIGDMWQISDHRPPIENTLKLDQINMQSTLEQMVAHLGTMATLAKPGAQKIYLEGNHEERWSRLLGDIQRHPKYRHLLLIPEVAEVLTMPYLLGLENLGYRYIPYYQGDRTVLNDKLLVMHGYKTNKWVTRGTLEAYGKSAMFGHTHRIQSFTKRDLAGTDAAWNIGCLCTLNPDWRQHTDWAHGFAVVTWRKLNDAWLFNVEQIRIHDGVAIWRDRVYKG